MLISIINIPMYTFENAAEITGFGQRHLDMLTWMNAALKL